jgi:hypothetical protein
MESLRKIMQVWAREYWNNGKASKDKDQSRKHEKEICLSQSRRGPQRTQENLLTGFTGLERSIQDKWLWTEVRRADNPRVSGQVFPLF